MVRIVKPAFGALLAAGVLATSWQFLRPAAHAEALQQALPAPVVDQAPARPGLQTATFAGGCFWGVQAVFQHVTGVTEALSGYAGGTVANPSYEQVSTGRTGHAESVRVTYDPAQVSFGKLLQIFFSVALDPTQVDRQGPDTGTQYRSEVFVQDAGQAETARAYVAQLEAAHAFDAPIATRIEPAGAFYPAEAYHQDYLLLHPNSSYIAWNDMPKVHGTQVLFPQAWRDKPVTVTEIAAAN